MTQVHTGICHTRRHTLTPLFNGSTCDVVLQLSPFFHKQGANTMGQGVDGPPIIFTPSSRPLKFQEHKNNFPLIIYVFKGLFKKVVLVSLRISVGLVTINAVFEPQPSQVLLVISKQLLSSLFHFALQEGTILVHRVNRQFMQVMQFTL